MIRLKKLEKIIAICLAVFLLAMCFTACGKKESTPTNLYELNTYDDYYDKSEYYDTLKNILNSTTGKECTLPIPYVTEDYVYKVTFGQFDPKKEFTKNTDSIKEPAQKMIYGESYIDDDVPVYVVFNYTQDNKEQKHLVIVGNDVLFDDIGFEETHDIQKLMQRVKDYRVPVIMPDITEVDNINYVGNKVGTRAYATISKERLKKIPYIALYRWFFDISNRDYDYFTLEIEGSSKGFTLSGGNVDIASYGVLDSEGMVDEENPLNLADKDTYYVLTDEYSNPVTSSTSPYGINGV